MLHQILENKPAVDHSTGKIFSSKIKTFNSAPPSTHRFNRGGFRVPDEAIHSKTPIFLKQRFYF
jgi:hypothetical protein